MPANPEIIKTSDGSYTIYLPDMQETYHSRHGAMAESLHVYIRNGLDRLKDKSHVNILEVGFGTGLNALLTIDHKLASQSITYYSIEPFPLEDDMMQAYYHGFEQQPESLDQLQAMLQRPRGSLHTIKEGFDFCLIQNTLQELSPQLVHHLEFDLLYYDAFGPSKQKDMWTLEMLKKATDMLRSGGILCTYCAQGEFKRNLKQLGFSVENPEGPLGKRQMTVATKG